jgi:SAM-dependent methyltransferase
MDVAMQPAVDRRQVCQICGARPRVVGTVEGRVAGRAFTVVHCDACGFGAVADPLTDFANIYDDAYYDGRGADPLVDYAFELAHPARTIRGWEWEGIAQVIRSLGEGAPGSRWLDFGCGNGGLVRHVRERHGVDAVGFEEGSMVQQLAEHGIPHIDRDELVDHGPFDVITAIEVLEHVLDPVAELRLMAQALRPGGILFATTGNAAPFQKRLAEWRYVVPEIHISFFEPRTLALAFEQAGLTVTWPGFVPGWAGIYKFRVLKNLRLRHRNVITNAIPARPLARAADRYVALAAHPVARGA